MLQNIKNFIKISKVLGFYLIIAMFFTACNKNAQNTNPEMSSKEKRERNISEGRGASLKGLIGGGGDGTNYEFSSSNPMWRASLETLDFLPLTTVDYSGGMIITDWYSDDTNNLKSLKITVSFLSNEIRTDSLKIIVHQKICSANGACSINLLDDSKIKQELYAVILKKAVLFEKETKDKKKKN